MTQREMAVEDVPATAASSHGIGASYESKSGEGSLHLVGGWVLCMGVVGSVSPGDDCQSMAQA